MNELSTKRRPINERVLLRHELFTDDGGNDDEIENDDTTENGTASSKTISDFMNNVNMSTESKSKGNNRRVAASVVSASGIDNGTMNISLNTILKSLAITEFSFSLGDVIRYTICALIVFMTLLYIFPQKLLLLFLLLVIVVLIMVYIALCRKIYQLQHKPINRAKLNAFRNVYFPRRDHQAASKPSKS